MKQPFQLRTTDTRTFYLAFENSLDGDTISTVTAVLPIGLTLVTAVSKNSTAKAIRGVTYAIATVAQITISGGTEGTIHTIPFTVTTVNGDIWVEDMLIESVADYDDQAEC